MPVPAPRRCARRRLATGGGGHLRATPSATRAWTASPPQLSPARYRGASAVTEGPHQVYCTMPGGVRVLGSATVRGHGPSARRRLRDPPAKERPGQADHRRRRGRRELRQGGSGRAGEIRPLRRRGLGRSARRASDFVAWALHNNVLCYGPGRVAVPLPVFSQRSFCCAARQDACCTRTRFNVPPRVQLIGPATDAPGRSGDLHVRRAGPTDRAARGARRRLVPARGRGLPRSGRRKPRPMPRRGAAGHAGGGGRRRWCSPGSSSGCSASGCWSPTARAPAPSASKPFEVKNQTFRPARSGAVSPRAAALGGHHRLSAPVQRPARVGRHLRRPGGGGAGVSLDDHRPQRRAIPPSPCSGASKPNQICHRLDAAGSYRFELRTWDGEKTSAAAELPVLVMPDAPPCIEQTEPSYQLPRIVVLSTERTNLARGRGERRRRRLPRRAGPAPRPPSSGGTARGVARLRPAAGATTMPTLSFAPDTFRPGDELEVRLDVLDRVARPGLHGACDGQPECRIDPDRRECWQRVTWRVSYL